MQEKFIDLFIENNNGLELSYRSGLTVYREKLIDGLFIGEYWNGSGFFNAGNFGVNLKGNQTHPRYGAFQLEVNGQLLNSHWEQVKEVEQQKLANGSLKISLILKHQLQKIEVTVNTILDGTPIICRWLEIKNNDSSSMAVSKISPWSGIMAKSCFGRNASNVEIGFMGEDGWGHEGAFQWVRLDHDVKMSVEGRYKRSRARHPFFAVRDLNSGCLFIGNLAWSGGYSFDFELLDELQRRTEAILFFDAVVDSPAPAIVLAANEKTSSPQMHLGMINGDFDEAVQAMHEHTRITVMNKPFKPESAGLVGYCNGPAQDMNWEVAKDEIDCAAEAGAELFWLDALWYAPEGADWNPSVGDWELSEARFPEGLEPVRKYVHERGMKFGLWMEPERAGKDSKVYREHPEWFIKSCNGDMKPQLDLSKAEVVEWMEGKITGLIERYKLDFFRLDCNMHLREGGSNLKDSYLENTVWRYYQNFYDMWERVTSKFPEVIFQNCAGGGGRTDLGLVKYFDNTWVTDWQLAPRSCSITNGMSMALPPERVCRLLGMEQGTHRAGNLDFQIRSAILVHPEVSWLKPKGSEHNEVNLSKLKHGLDIYKNFIRPIQAESRVFHHTPQLEGGEDPTGWWVIELASADRTKSVAGLFRMSEPAGDTYHLTFKGLQISKRYKVTFDNSGDSLELSGFELVNRGLEVKISSALMSELIIVEAVV